MGRKVKKLLAGIRHTFDSVKCNTIRKHLSLRQMQHHSKQPSCFQLYLQAAAFV